MIGGKGRIVGGVGGRVVKGYKSYFLKAYQTLPCFLATAGVAARLAYDFDCRLRVCAYVMRLLQS